MAQTVKAHSLLRTNTRCAPTAQPNELKQPHKKRTRQKKTQISCSDMFILESAHISTDKSRSKCLRGVAKIMSCTDKSAAIPERLNHGAKKAHSIFCNSMEKLRCLMEMFRTTTLHLTILTTHTSKRAPSHHWLKATCWTSLQSDMRAE